MRPANRYDGTCLDIDRRSQAKVIGFCRTDAVGARPIAGTGHGISAARATKSSGSQRHPMRIWVSRNSSHTSEKDIAPDADPESDSLPTA
jgi:hypothetical protein